jgi:hypothetical protein
MTKKRRETRIWQFDPSAFRPLPKAGFFERRIRSPARSLAKHALYGLAFAYPILLVSLGIFFGGLAFWTGLAGSMLLLWIILRKTGYARNFESWDISYKHFLGLIGGFGIALALFYGLIYTPIRLMTIPLVGGILLLALVVILPRIANREASTSEFQY